MGTTIGTTSDGNNLEKYWPTMKHGTGIIMIPLMSKYAKLLLKSLRSFYSSIRCLPWQVEQIILSLHQCKWKLSQKSTWKLICGRTSYYAKYIAGVRTLSSSQKNIRYMKLRTSQIRQHHPQYLHPIFETYIIYNGVVKSDRSFFFSFCFLIK